MRFVLEFFVNEELLIPFSYQYPISSWIYAVLASGNPSFAQFLHNSGIDFHGKGYKLFVFSQLKPEKVRVIKGKGLLVKGKIQLEVGSPLSEFTQAFVVGAYQVPLRLQQREIMLTRMTIVNLPTFAERMKYQLLGPMVYSYMEDGKLIFGHPLQQKFYTGLCQSTMNRYLAICQYQQVEPVIQTIDSISFELLQRDEFSLSKAAKLFDYKGKKIKGYQWPIEVRAPREFQQFIYLSGFSQLTNQGFGMVSVLEKGGGEFV